MNTELQKIAESRHHDPFAVLGKHPVGKGIVVRTFMPGASAVTIADGELPMQRIPDSDFFEWHGDAGSIPDRYRLLWRDTHQHEHIRHDPYCFPPDFRLRYASVRRR